jgi:hypothetical protein
MAKSKRLRCYRLCSMLLFIHFPGILEANDTEPPLLPVWQILEFEQRAFFATAKSSLEVMAAPDRPGQWALSVNSSVLDNSEEVFLILNPTDGQVLYRTRFSRGKNQRFKMFQYGENGVRRERRDPGEKNAAATPEEWKISSIKEIAYPSLTNNRAVTDAYALVLLAGQLLEEPGQSLDVVVHTEFNFYTVKMTSSPGISIDVDYEIDGVGNITGKRNTTAIKLKVAPLGEPLEEPDFSLLGLHGYIILFFDTESGLLLRLLGQAPRIGKTEINIKKAVLRAPQE